MKYAEFIDLLEEDRVEHFEDSEDAKREYHRLLKDSPDIASSAPIHEAYRAAVSEPEAPQPSGRLLSEEETQAFHKELEAAAPGKESLKVLAKYGRLANAAEHGMAS